MLSEFFESRARIRAIRSGPCGARLESFATYLFESGYANISARRHIRSAEHIIHWVIRRRLSLLDLDRSAVQRFGDHLISCHCGRYCRENRVDILAGARLFLGHLQVEEERAIVCKRLHFEDPRQPKHHGNRHHLIGHKRDSAYHSHSRDPGYAIQHRALEE